MMNESQKGVTNLAAVFDAWHGDDDTFGIAIPIDDLWRSSSSSITTPSLQIPDDVVIDKLSTYE